MSMCNVCGWSMCTCAAPNASPARDVEARDAEYLRLTASMRTEIARLTAELAAAKAGISGMAKALHGSAPTPCEAPCPGCRVPRIFNSDGRCTVCRIKVFVGDESPG